MASKEQLVRDRVSALFQQTFGTRPDLITRLPGSGSTRQYFRLADRGTNAIGVFNEDRKENDAFVSFTRTFRSLDLPVPDILAEDPENSCYLVSDLGDMTLFRYLTETRGGRDIFPDHVSGFYRQALSVLLRFQIIAGKQVDYNTCYPRHAFDRPSIRWDLNYFKYYFLKLTGISFDEQALEDDFDAFADFLIQAPASFFLYRDFQSRNIMLFGNKLYFIDYQGGRRGALPYDVASLLYDAKAGIPEKSRNVLLECYLEELEKYLPRSRAEFLRFYPAFVLVRILQALGAYGFRGYYEKKSHFLQSIPYALNNLRYLRNLWLNQDFGVELPTLFRLLGQLIDDPGFRTPDSGSRIKDPVSLTVTITSFAFSGGIPDDPAGHGGGFVFDCRALPNPGRLNGFSDLTGRDQPVIDFLVPQEAVDRFLDHAINLVEQSVTNYLERGFSHLQVSFGCTGGRHRSVFCAERMKEYFSGKDGIRITVNHTGLKARSEKQKAKGEKRNQ